MCRFRNGKILSSRKKKCFSELTTVYFMYRFCDCIYFQSNLPVFSWWNRTCWSKWLSAWERSTNLLANKSCYYRTWVRYPVTTIHIYAQSLSYITEPRNVQKHNLVKFLFTLKMIPFSQQWVKFWVAGNQNKKLRQMWHLLAIRREYVLFGERLQLNIFDCIFFFSNSLEL